GPACVTTAVPITMIHTAQKSRIATQAGTPAAGSSWLSAAQMPRTSDGRFQHPEAGDHVRRQDVTGRREHAPDGGAAVAGAEQAVVVPSGRWAEAGDEARLARLRHVEEGDALSVPGEVRAATGDLRVVHAVRQRQAAQELAAGSQPVREPHRREP